MTSSFISCYISSFNTTRKNKGEKKKVFIVLLFIFIKKFRNNLYFRCGKYLNYK